MMSSIIVFLGIALAPFWFYGDIIGSLDQDRGVLGEASCQEESCQLSDGQMEDGEEESIGRYNVFPVNTVAASGLIPTRKEGVPDIKIWSGASVAIDAGTGTIIHYDNGSQRTQIASLTKMMTAILVVENIKDLDEEVIVTREALNTVGTVVGCPTSVFCNGNRMYVGEKIAARDLLKAMLMNSANDASNVLSIHVGGTTANFVGMMNKKAKEIGLKDTNFCTPSGLEVDGKEHECYSTAYDIARIGAYSMKYKVIWDIMNTPEGRFYSTDGKYMHELKNTVMPVENLPGCIGGKTGFTPLAGKTLLLGAEDPTGKHKIISVILNDENRWDDMRTLINWTFENYRWQ